MVLARHQRDLLQLQPRLDILTAQLGTCRLGEHVLGLSQDRTVISHFVEYQTTDDLTRFTVTAFVKLFFFLYSLDFVQA